MPHPPQLTVEIRCIGEGQYLAITQRAGGAEVCQSTFAYDPDLLRHKEPQWLLEPRCRGTRARRSPQAADAASWPMRSVSWPITAGSCMPSFSATGALPPIPGSTTTTAAAPADAGAAPRRGRLWRLPWEYLCDDAGFLALSGRLLLSRTPLGLGELSPAAVEPPLRILVVVAAPDDQRPLDTEEEIRLIQESLDEAVQAGRVQVDYLDDATLPAIGDALRRLQPHILHYTGHGAYDEAKGASFLALEDDDGCTRLAGIAV